MGHHLLPVPSNFPVPGHRVRHSALVAVDRLPSSHPVGMAMKSHDASEKAAVAQIVNGVWIGSKQPIREDVSAAVLFSEGSWLQFGTHKRDDGLVCWWYDGMTGTRVGLCFLWAVCVCLCDHANRCGRVVCPWRDPAWLQTTWPPRGTSPCGCPSTHPHPHCIS